jgi:acyl carrier protein
MDENKVAPRTELETTLARIWCNTLGVDCVGVNDDFYDVGGHSLLAMSLSSQIASELHVDLPAEDVPQWPTIAAQADAITRAITGHDADAPWTP